MAVLPPAAVVAESACASRARAVEAAPTDSVKNGDGWAAMVGGERRMPHPDWIR